MMPTNNFINLIANALTRINKNGRDRTKTCMMLRRRIIDLWVTSGLYKSKSVITIA